MSNLTTLHDNLAQECEDLMGQTFADGLHCRACDMYGESTCNAKHYEDCPEVRRQLNVIYQHLHAAPQINSK